jgi:hypothetical protein
MRDLYAPLRPRFDRDALELSRRPVGLGPEGQPAFVGRISEDSNQPTTTGRYYLVNPVSVLGEEAEGTTANLIVDPTTTALVCVLGTQAPSTGDNLICRFVENRWVAERDGHAGGPPPPPFATIPTCYCDAIPVTLTMSSSGPCVSGDFQDCTLQWVPTPSQFNTLSLGVNCFLSTQDFTDPISGLQFRYTMGCSNNLLSISRVYEPTSSSEAYHDSTLYSWAVGASGNSCSPFLLSNGTIYPGGNPNCLVVISQ